MIYMLGFALGFMAEACSRVQEQESKAPAPVWTPWYGCTWTSYTRQPQLQ